MPKPKKVTVEPLHVDGRGVGPDTVEDFDGQHGQHGLPPVPVFSSDHQIQPPDPQDPKRGSGEGKVLGPHQDGRSGFIEKLKGI